MDQISNLLRFEISNLIYHDIPVHIASKSHFGRIYGHGGLQMASEVEYDLRIKISDLNNPIFRVSLTCKCFP